jgi:predicted DNA-binding transcriptional regulator AlpA
VRLDDSIVKILEQVGLPTDRLISFRDLQLAGIVKDYAMFRRLKNRELAFPEGRWIGENQHRWLAEEIGNYLLRCPTESQKGLRRRQKKLALDSPPAAVVTEMPAAASTSVESAPVPLAKKRRQRRA